MPRGYSLEPEVLACVARQLHHLRGQVLEHSCRVHCSSPAHSVHTSHATRELEASSSRS